MKLHPAVLHSSETAAILAGKQTQIRLPAWKLNKQGERAPSRYQALKPGDLLWVQEPFVEYEGWRRGAGKHGIGYGHVGRAPCPPHMRDVEKKVHPRRPETMWRSQSRLTLEVTAARIEKLHDISSEDVLASGFTERLNGGRLGYAPFADPVPSCWGVVPMDAYQKFHGVRFGHNAWAYAGEVVAIAFTTHAQNVGHLLETRWADDGANKVAAEALR